MNKNIKIEKKIHPLYNKWKSGGVAQKYNLYPPYGEYQYIYTFNDASISLIYLPFGRYWEICCLEGCLFDDVESFSTKEQAQKRIEYLYFSK